MYMKIVKTDGGDWRETCELEQTPPRRGIVCLNMGSHDDGLSLWVLAFGSGPLELAVFSSGLGDALDTCVDWLSEHAPGCLEDQRKLLNEAADEVTRGEGETYSNWAARVEARAMLDSTAVGTSGECWLRIDSWGVSHSPDSPERPEWVEFLQEYAEETYQ